MGRRTLAVLALALASVGSTAGQQPTQGHPGLEAVIDAVLARGGRGGAQAGVPAPDPAELLARLRAIDPRDLTFDEQIDRRFAETILIGRLVAAPAGTPMGDAAYSRMLREQHLLPYDAAGLWTLGSTDALTPEHARREARKMMGRVASGDDPRDARKAAREESRRQLPLGKFVNEVYGPWAEANRKTGATTISRLKTVFSDLLTTPLNDISPFVIEKWRTRRVKAGLSPATINRDLVTLRAALSRATDWGYLSRHPLSSVKQMRVDNRGVVRYLSAAEEARLQEALDNRDKRRRAARASANEWREVRHYELLPTAGAYTDHLNPMVRLALNTGLRFGELTALVWGDVTLTTNAHVTVRGEGAKSGRTRHVPLHDKIAAVLKAWKPTDASAEDLVFPGRDGDRLQDIKTAWKHLLKDAKITNFRFHDCRHHFASRLVQSGADLNVVRDLLGQADFTMTLRYSHLAPDNRRAAVARLRARAQLLAAIGNWGHEAIDVNTRLLEADPHATDALTRLARCFCECGKAHSAAEVYRQVLALDPTNRIARNHLASAESAARQSDVFGAIELIQSYDEAFAVGISASRARQYDTAAPALMRAVELVPTSTHAWNALGAVHRHRGELQQAVAAYQRALALKSNSASLVGLAAVLRDKGDHGGAEELFANVLRKDRRNTFALNGLAGVYFDCGRLADAENLFQAAALIGHTKDIAPGLELLRLKYAERGDELAERRVSDWIHPLPKLPNCACSQRRPVSV